MCLCFHGNPDESVRDFSWLCFLSNLQLFMLTVKLEKVLIVFSLAAWKHFLFTWTGPDEKGALSECGDFCVFVFSLCAVLSWAQKTASPSKCLRNQVILKLCWSILSDCWTFGILLTSLWLNVPHLRSNATYSRCQMVCWRHRKQETLICLVFLF